MIYKHIFLMYVEIKLYRFVPDMLEKQHPHPPPAPGEKRAESGYTWVFRCKQHRPWQECDL